MLRITPKSDSSGGRTLHLAGRVAGPWVEELRRACEAALASGGPLRLDMSQVSYLDQQAVDLCSRLRLTPVELVACSPFVLEQIAQATPPAAAENSSADAPQEAREIRP